MNIDALKILRRSITTSAILALPVALALTSVAQSPAPQKAQGRDVTTDVDRPASAPIAKPPAAAAPAVSKDKAAASSAATSGGTKATTKEVAIGTAVFCSDGQKMGEVNGVKSDSGGVVEEIHVKTGGLFGLGGKVLIVPGAKITAGGQTVQLALTSVEAGKLPVFAAKKG